MSAHAEPIAPTDAHLAIAYDVVSENILGGDLREQIARAIAEAEARGRRLGQGGNQPPAELLPERLIDPDVLPDLLARNYEALIERGDELSAAIKRWKALHLVPKPDDWPEGKAWPERYAIPSDEDNGKTSNFVRLLTSYAGGKSAASGEVNEAREKVKAPIIAAGKVVDGWFGTLRDGIRADMAIMDRAQIEYLQDKARKEQQKRDAEAAAALEEANRLAEAARLANGADDITEKAVIAEEKAEAAVKAAEAPATDMTRTRTAEGTTTSLGGKWIWRLADIKALAKAVIAGDVPSMFLTTNDSVIGAAVRPANGLRTCPGLVIENEAKLNRSGRTA
jgi:hypothetical protein